MVEEMWTVRKNYSVQMQDLKKKVNSPLTTTIRMMNRFTKVLTEWNERYLH